MPACKVRAGNDTGRAFLVHHAVAGNAERDHAIVLRKWRRQPVLVRVDTAGNELVGLAHDRSGKLTGTQAVADAHLGKREDLWVRGNAVDGRMPTEQKRRAATAQRTLRLGQSVDRFAQFVHLFGRRHVFKGSVAVLAEVVDGTREVKLVDPRLKVVGNIVGAEQSPTLLNAVDQRLEALAHRDEVGVCRPSFVVRSCFGGPLLFAHLQLIRGKCQLLPGATLRDCRYSTGRHGNAGAYWPRPNAHAYPCASIASNTLGGDSGRSSMRNPSWSRTAFDAAARGATIGVSPTPRTP